MALRQDQAHPGSDWAQGLPGRDPDQEAVSSVLDLACDYFQFDRLRAAGQASPATFSCRQAFIHVELRLRQFEPETEVS